MKKRQHEKEKAETACQKEIQQQHQAKDRAEKAQVRAAKVSKASQSYEEVLHSST
jgi:hypothetical protein